MPKESVVKKEHIWSRDIVDETEEQFKQGRRGGKEWHSPDIAFATSSEVSRSLFGKVFVLTHMSLLFHPLSDFSMGPPQCLRRVLLAQL